MDKLNELRDEIHALAIEKGWWDEERNFAEIIALCHSELSEALEGYRDGNPNIWYDCKLGGLAKNEDCFAADCFTCHSKTPEGIAIELADCIIRILDYCGHAGIDIDGILSYRRAGNDTYTLPILVAECHCLLSQSYKSQSSKDVLQSSICFAECIALIRFWCKENSIDIDDAIRIKHKYNKSRPYRHGNKVL